MIALVTKSHDAENPRLEAMDNHCTRVSWQGAVIPKQIDGLDVNYCQDGMMWLGPINTPVRYRDVSVGTEQILELEISLAGLKMLHAPQRDYAHTASMALAR